MTVYGKARLDPIAIGLFSGRRLPAVGKEARMCVGLFLSALCRGGIFLCCGKGSKPLSLALRQLLALSQLTRKANTGCGIVKMICREPS